MDENAASVRQGITNAKKNESAFSLYAARTVILVLASGFGVEYEFPGYGWYVGVGALLGLLALSQSRLGKPVGVVLRLPWGATGFLLGSVFVGTPGGIVCAVILALLGIGANLCAAELMSDLKRN